MNYLALAEAFRQCIDDRSHNRGTYDCWASRPKVISACSCRMSDETGQARVSAAYGEVDIMTSYRFCHLDSAVEFLTAHTFWSQRS